MAGAVVGWFTARAATGADPGAHEAAGVWSWRRTVAAAVLAAVLCAVLVALLAALAGVGRSGTGPSPGSGRCGGRPGGATLAWVGAVALPVAVLVRAWRGWGAAASAEVAEGGEVADAGGGGLWGWVSLPSVGRWWGRGDGGGGGDGADGGGDAPYDLLPVDSPGEGPSRVP